eukprot:gb/GECG01006459.1/.p1 GENE.gb/GECG01006459.1/~~gb/GECG01006459.1/.p1  ORF type:complete len:500 (+),score=51.93 gb/GECG01006459.1/:1-1500(+)
MGRKDSGSKRKTSTKEHELVIDLKNQGLTADTLYNRIQEAIQEQTASASDHGKILRKLNLAENPALKTLHGLADIAPRLTWLNVAGCGLCSESLTDIKDLEELSVLNAGNNAIKQIPGGALSNCKRLKALILNNNKIRKLENVGHLGELNTLVLSHNKLESIEHGPLKSMPKLAKLSIAHNRLGTFPAISHLYGLQELRLNDNQLRNVPDGIRSMNHLRMVDVGSNQISDYPSLGPLLALKGLRHVVIQGNPVAGDDKLTQSYANSCTSISSNEGVSPQRAESLRQSMSYADLIRRVFPAVQMIDNVRVMGNPRGKRSRREISATSTESKGGSSDAIRVKPQRLDKKHRLTESSIVDTHRERSTEIRSEAATEGRTDSIGTELNEASKMSAASAKVKSPSHPETEVISAREQVLENSDLSAHGYTRQSSKDTRAKKNPAGTRPRKLKSSEAETQSEIYNVSTVKKREAPNAAVPDKVGLRFASPVGALPLDQAGWDTDE